MAKENLINLMVTNILAILIQDTVVEMVVLIIIMENHIVENGSKIDFMAKVSTNIEMGMFIKGRF